MFLERRLDQHESDQEGGAYWQRMEIIRPEKFWIKQLAKEKRIPALRLFLENEDVVTAWELINSHNGRHFDLAAYLAGYFNAVVLHGLNKSDDLDRYLNEEYRSWVKCLVNPSSLVIEPRVLVTSEILFLWELVVPFHEISHVILGHDGESKFGSPKKARRLLRQESEASDLAIRLFAPVVAELDLPEMTLYRSKRLLDAMYFSYLVEIVAKHGETGYGELRQLDLSRTEKKILRWLIDWVKHGVHFDDERIANG